MINLKKNVVILGSTGSIGTQTADVIRHSENFKILAVTAQKNIKVLEEQIREFSPEYACIADESLYSDLKTRVSDTNTKILTSQEGLMQTASLDKSDIVLSSIVGIAGLKPTLCAIEAKKTIALANKETLVCAGELVNKKAEENGVDIIPVDSEHSAIFQCLKNEKKEKIQRIILTASGGPFFGKKKDELLNITKNEALKHPNWVMGQKITIDSATLMNKGLEVIEAKWLFGVDAKKITPMVHRQSIIHSMVEFVDNSIIAQLGSADMRTPISYALNYPNREKSVSKRLDFSKISSLTFDEPDYETFKCLSLAFSAIEKGSVMCSVLNGANEAAVDLFLKDKIKFLDIADLIGGAMASFDGNTDVTLENVFYADDFARKYVFGKVKQ